MSVKVQKPEELAAILEKDATRKYEMRLSPVKTKETAKAAPNSRSYADLLNRLYTQFDNLADEIALSDAPAHQKAEALQKLARTLPMLKAAEDATKVEVQKRDISALTDEELETLVTAQLGKKTRFPFTPEIGALAPTPSNKAKNGSRKKKPIEDVDNFTTEGEDDE